MSNIIMEAATAQRFSNIDGKLASAKQQLSPEVYAKIEKAFKQLLLHTLMWILISATLSGIICGICFYASNKQQEDLMTKFNADEWWFVSKSSETEIYYTHNLRYYVDTTSIGINLDEDFPGVTSFVGYFDTEDNLCGLISYDEYDAMSNLKLLGIILALVIMVAILIGFYIYARYFSSYGKVWYSFIRG
jgi:hypothetical protein